MTRDYIPMPTEPPDDYYDDHEWSDEEIDLGWCEYDEELQEEIDDFNQKNIF